MPNFAMMNGNMVGNVIVADDKESTEAALNCILIEVTAENPAGIGWTYDPETGKFNPPAMTDEQVKRQDILTKLGITEEELNLLIK